MSALNLYRSLLIGSGAFLLGMAALVIREYAAAAIAGRGALVKHVAAIAASYCLLILFVAGANVQAIIDQRPFRWPLVIPPLAYAFGVYALTVILRDVRLRREHGQTRRRTDP